MARLPIRLDRGIAVLEAFVETSGAGHVFQARLENLPALLGELMVAGEADPGLFGLPIPFSFGTGASRDEADARQIRGRADELWEQFQAELRDDPPRAVQSRERYLRAIDSRLAANPDVGAKLLRRDESRNWAGPFAAEDEALRRLNHRNILRRYGCFTDSQLGPCLILERVRGKTLERIWRHRMERGHGPLPLPAVGHIAYQLAHALAHAHGLGVVHGDLRPANLQIEDPAPRAKAKGIVKIGNFGVDGSPGRDAVVYAAPEQVRDGRASPPTDVYQLGTTLFVLATGKLPYEMESAESVKTRLLSAEPHPNRAHHLRPDISSRFEAVIEGAREKDPGKRWPLERVVEGITQVYTSKAFSLEGGPNSSLAEELLDRAQGNATLKEYYRAVEALDLAGDFLKGVPVDRGGEVLRRYDELSRQLEPQRAAVESIRKIHRRHIAPVDRVMEELYRRYGRGEPLLTTREKGVMKQVGQDVVVEKRSLIDWVLHHTSEAIKELSRIDPELVGEMHRKMVDRASSQEVAACDLAARMIKFGDDYVGVEPED